MTPRPVGQCSVCGRKNLTLVWANNQHFPTTVRAHGPKKASTTAQAWCPGSARPPKGTT